MESTDCSLEIWFEQACQTSRADCMKEVSWKQDLYAWNVVSPENEYIRRMIMQHIGLSGSDFQDKFASLKWSAVRAFLVCLRVYSSGEAVKSKT